MKAQSKRFLDHKGKSYKMGFQSKKERKSNDSVGFLDLWRYATTAELAVTALGVLLSWCCSVGLVSAVVIYGELTSLFVQRHTASSTTSHAHILALFGGGKVLERGNRTLHMDALVDDSVAYALASVAVMFIQWSTAAIAVNLANWAADRMVNRLRWQLLRSVISQEIAFFDTNTSMNFAATVTEDMEKFRGGVGEHVVMTSYLGGTVVAGGALSLAYGWELTLVGFAIVPVSILVAAVVAKYQTRCSAEEVSAYGAAGRIAEEVFTNIRTVRAYAGEQVEVESYSEALEPAAAAARRRGVWSGAGAGLGWLCTYSLNAVVFGYGARLIVRDMDLPPDQQIYHPGVLVTILFCTFMAAQNIAMCHPHLEIFSSARGAARSLYGLLARRSQIDALEDRGVKPDKFRGDIRFENIYFNYPSRPDVKVLRGLTLSVRAGETVALVGASGCGKSTLLQLLQRMYEPHSGSLSVDQVPLDDLHLHHFRSSIGVVGQEPVLFSGTIRDNITLGLDNVSEADLIAAAKTAHAHQFITKLANGYETTLGERGASLSGGQKQRIAIARAVLRRPAILLLDEPTSALDPASERQVQVALDAASKGRTTLVVSHRLSTIVNASRIVYMEHGAVLEQGTHLELLEKRGLYWKLVQEDMTNKSIATTVTSEEKEEDISESENHFVRAARPSRRESLTPERHLRGSLRVASISSAHIANTAVPDLINHMETLEDEEEMCADVSTWDLLKLNRPEWGLLMAGGMASFLVGATMPVFAYLFSKIYGMFAWPDGAAILSTSQLYAGLFAGVAGACGAVTFLQAWLLSVAGARLTDRLRPTLLTSYMRQEQGWFDAPQHSVGALCARLAADASAVQGATGTRLGTMLQGISTMVIGIGLAMAYSWRMTLVSLVSVPCVMGGIYLESFITRRSEMKQKRALESASRIATEAVLNVRTVQSLGVENTILARYRSALDESGHKSAWIRGAVYGICLCAPTLGYAVSLAYGGYLIAREDLPYEYAILVSEALIYGAWMLAEALSFAPSFAAAKRSGARVVAALNRQPTICTEKTAKLDPNWNATGDIALSDVHFNYPTRNDVTVLRGASLKVPAGNTVALVGASGSGKSTILQLLTRAYDASSGVLNVAGRNIRSDLPLEQLREQFGIVAQEPALFSRTIRDNIAYGDNSRRVSLDEIMRVAQQAHVHSFIASLPLGYDTVLSSGGTSLSGGQKQRVAIARALLRNPRVLLLDEATSALDANSEKSVQEALEAASKDRTTIIVAHRLATIQHADLIHVLDKGVVAESGTHDELVKRRGLYWELLQQQANTAPA